MNWIMRVIYGKEGSVERELGIKLNRLQKEVINVGDCCRGIVVFGKQGRGVTTALRARVLWLAWKDKKRDILFYGARFPAPGNVRFNGEVKCNTLVVIDDADEIAEIDVMETMMASGGWIIGGEYTGKESNQMLFRIYSGCDLQVEILANTKRVVFQNSTVNTVGIRAIV